MEMQRSGQLHIREVGLTDKLNTAQEEGEGI